MPYKLLIVDPDLASADRIEQILSGAGYIVATVESFEEAKTQIALDCPDLLITDVRLGAFNGFHLIVRSVSDCPDLPAIVTTSTDKAFTKAEAERQGITYLPKPWHPPAWLETVAALLNGKTPRHPVGTRRWPRKSVTTALPAVVSDAPALVVG